MKKLFTVITALLMLLIACTAMAETPAVTDVRLTATQVKLLPGETAELEYTVSPEGAEAVFTWTSSNESVATVDASGVVTAVAPGTAQIRGKLENGPQRTIGAQVTVLAMNTEKVELTVEDINGTTVTFPCYKDLNDGTITTRVSGDAAQVTIDWADNVATMKVQPVKVGKTVVEFKDKANQSNVRTYNIVVGADAIPDALKVRFVQTKLKIGSSVRVSGRLQNNCDQDILEVYWLMQCRDSFGKLLMDEDAGVSGDDNADTSSYKYDHLLHTRYGTIEAGKNVRVKFSDYYTSRSEGCADVKIAVCYYRLADGTKVYIPDSQLCWLDLVTEEMEIPESFANVRHDAEVIEAGEYLWSGLTYVDVYSFYADEFFRPAFTGRYVQYVEGIAAYSGLKSGDLLRGVEGVLWEDDHEVFTAAKARIAAGETVEFNVYRNGEEITVPVSLNGAGMETIQVCPYCKQTIRADATRCPYCAGDLNTAEEASATETAAAETPATGETSEKAA